MNTIQPKPAKLRTSVSRAKIRRAVEEDSADACNAISGFDERIFRQGFS